MNAHDKEFLADFSQLLKQSNDLKFDQGSLDQILQSFSMPAIKGENAGVKDKVAFVKAILAERTFFINFIKSLLRRLAHVTSRNASSILTPE